MTGKEGQSKRETEVSLSFEDAFRRLEETAASLEEGGLTLEEATARFQEGMDLVRHCNQLLGNAELKITELKDSYAASLLDEATGEESSNGPANEG